jgi:anti-anti-sigma factor
MKSITVVTLAESRLDDDTAPAFQARLLAALASSARVIVDLTNVAMISSGGLRVFVAAARESGGKLVVCGLQPIVREVFEISRFDALFPIFATLEAVHAALDAEMRVVFWGTRGSLPTPLNARDVRAKIRHALLAARAHELTSEAAIDAFIDGELPFEVRATFGGNSSCVQIDDGGSEYVVCDAGSGLRVFGNAVLAEHGPGVPHTYNICLSHLHWDHIMGFPFFTPAYVAGNHIRIFSCHADPRAALERQHGPPSFPIPFTALGATIEFVHLEPNVPTPIGRSIVTASLQRHGGDSYGYRFEHAGKSVVYATDSEHKLTSADDLAPYVTFFRDADVLIFDAMYSLGDAMSMKEDWGHSSNVVGVELAHHAGVKHLVLFHHEPMHDDAALEQLLHDTRRFEEITGTDELTISSAYDGLEIVV